MGKIAELITFLKTCPRLEDMLTIAGNEYIDNLIIYPQGSSEKFNYEAFFDIEDNYECQISPIPTYYEDYQINCFKPYEPNDTSSQDVNSNILSYEQVVDICEWIAEQNDNDNLPSITNEIVIAIECNPSLPQIRNIDIETGIITYFITLRVYMVNQRRGKTKTYAI